MRKLFLLVFLVFTGQFHAQSFYEKIMEMNTANADTSTDIGTLERSAYAMERVSRGVQNNWQATYHIALCFVRITDLFLLKKDTLMAKMKHDMATQYLRKIDSSVQSIGETEILAFYNNLNATRTKKLDKKEIKMMEVQTEQLIKKYNNNPRAYLVSSYFYSCFYASNKGKRKKALELLEEAGKLFEKEQVNEFQPKWGKKWRLELLVTLNKIPKN